MDETTTGLSPKMVLRLSDTFRELVIFKTVEKKRLESELEKTEASLKELQYLEAVFRTRAMRLRLEEAQADLEKAGGPRPENAPPSANPEEETPE